MSRPDAVNEEILQLLLVPIGPSMPAVPAGVWFVLSALGHVEERFKSTDSSRENRSVSQNSQTLDEPNFEFETPD